MQDIKNSEEYKSLWARANYDDLTKVLNRRAGRERLISLLEKARTESRILVVALCDVNDLKQINDRHGHREGDNMLRYVAMSMSRELKENDVLFRLSGDEFAMAFYDENEKNAEKRMQRILAYLNEKKNSRKLMYETSFSYGLVEIYPEEYYMVEDLLEKADCKMYIQKRNYHILRAKQRLEQQNDSGVREFIYDKEHLYDALMESTDDYIFVGNMKTGVFRYPPAMVREFGLPGEVVENAAAFWGGKIHPYDERHFLESNQEIADGRMESHDIEYRAKNARGEWIWLRCRGRMIRDERGEPNLFAGMITHLGRNHKTDHMTGLYNRFEFEGDAKKYMVDLEETEYLGIMLLDMDGFRNINDLNNRSFGDAVLKITAQKIVEFLPSNARVYRMDGDEFAVLFLNGSKEDAMEVFSRIQSHFQKIQDYKGRKYYCTMSAGYASYPEDSDDYQELLQYANYSLECSKLKGKNRLTVFTKEILESRGRKLEMTELLRESIERGFTGFSLNYQPQIVSGTKQLSGAEALARWQCTAFGDVPPSEFIRILEQSGLIIKAGKWVFTEAVRQCSQWIKRKPDFRMSINLSYPQMLEEDFESFVLGTLDSFHVPYENITLEVTETYLIEQDSIVHDIMGRLQEKGIQTAMDDFGMGYSSLFELKNTPADIVKIDKGFVNGLTTDLFTATFIRSITELCHDVGKTVCLEGVKTVEDYNVAKEIGIDLIQGYYFSKAVPPAEFEEVFLEERNASVKRN